NNRSFNVYRCPKIQSISNRLGQGSNLFAFRRIHCIWDRQRCERHPIDREFCGETNDQDESTGKREEHIMIGGLVASNTSIIHLTGPVNTISCGLSLTEYATE